MSTGVVGTVELAASIFLRKSGDCSVSARAFFRRATTGSGILAGPISTNQVPMSMPLRAGCSASAGMSGVTAERLASVVPRATTLPLLMCGSPLDSTNTPYSRLPPSRSLASGATPRYGMWVRNTPACSFTISPARCSDVPTPELP